MARDKISSAVLDKLVERLNKETNSPLTMYTKLNDGSLSPNGGHYLLSETYGYISLERMLPGGGVENPLSEVYKGNRNAYNAIRAYMIGLRKGCQSE